MKTKRTTTLSPVNVVDFRRTKPSAVGGIAIVVIGLLIIMWRTSDPNFANGVVPTPVDGLTIFATFFVVAQAIERLLEPISSVLLPTTEKKDEAAKKADEAAAKVSAWEAASESERDTKKEEAERALKAAAEAKAQVDRIHHHRVVTFWALATILAMAASALLKLYFLRQVGISTGARWIEILATGLIIGAGTKPLHDLVTMISAKKEQTQAPGSQATV